MSDPVRLRGHHFVCLQFYRGQGYDGPFVTNLNDVLERLGSSAALVVSGADDVCAACPHLSREGVCTDPRAGEAEVSRIDALAAELLGLHPGESFSIGQAADLLASDAAATGRWRYEACHGCDWEAVCEPGWDALTSR